jgi:hypothetical protein
MLFGFRQGRIFIYFFCEVHKYTFFFDNMFCAGPITRCGRADRRTATTNLTVTFELFEAHNLFVFTLTYFGLSPRSSALKWGTCRCQPLWRSIAHSRVLKKWFKKMGFCRAVWLNFKIGMTLCEAGRYCILFSDIFFHIHQYHCMNNITINCWLFRH